MAIVQLTFRFVGDEAAIIDDLVAGTVTVTTPTDSQPVFQTVQWDDAVTDTGDVIDILREAGWIVDTPQLPGPDETIVTQIGHGFVVGAFPLPAYVTPGGVYALAQADDEATLRAVYITRIASPDEFAVKAGGRIHNAPAHGLPVGQYAFLSATTAGDVVSVSPAGGISEVVFFAIDTDNLLLVDNRPSLGSVASVTNPSFKAANLDTATNLNVLAPGVDVPTVGAVQLDEGGIYTTVGATGVQVSEAGEYIVRSNVHLIETGGIRINLRFQYAINGTLTGAIAANNYIRNASGHEESSSSLVELLTLNVGDTVTLRAIREAGAGTVSMAVAGDSYLWLEKR